MGAPVLLQKSPEALSNNFLLTFLPERATIWCSDPAARNVIVSRNLLSSVRLSTVIKKDPQIRPKLIIRIMRY